MSAYGNVEGNPAVADYVHNLPVLFATVVGFSFLQGFCAIRAAVSLIRKWRRAPPAWLQEVACKECKARAYEDVCRHYKSNGLTASQDSFLEIVVWLGVVGAVHFLLPLLCVPVVLLGWEGGVVPQVMFVACVSMHAGWDLFDESRLILTYIFPKVFTCMFRPPLLRLKVMTAHHGATLMVILPTLYWYFDHPGAHLLEFVQTLVGGIDYTFANYKLTLTAATKRSTYFKAISVAHLILSGLMRFPMLLFSTQWLLRTFWADGNYYLFFAAGLGGVLTTGFNLFTFRSMLQVVVPMLREEATKWRSRISVKAVPASGEESVVSPEGKDIGHEDLDKIAASKVEPSLDKIAASKVEPIDGEESDDDRVVVYL